MNHLKNENIVFISAARSAVTKYLGDFRNIKVQDLSRYVLEEAIKRAKIDKNEIDEIIVGNVLSSQTSSNLASVIGIDMGLKDEFTAMTVNRICGSGLQSAVSAIYDLISNKKKVIAVGGVESMSRSPMILPEDSRFREYSNPKAIDSNFACLKSCSGTYKDISNMGITAENIAQKYNISKEEQDKFALNSQNKALKARQSKRFLEEIIGIEVIDENNNKKIIDEDQQIRDTSLEKLSSLKAVFKENGSVSAGNSSSFNDGAAFEIMSTRDYAKKNNLDIMASLIDYSITGIAPEYMGLGPVQAIKNILKDNNLDLEKDIDYLEINEAFSAQVLGCLNELNISTDSKFYKEKFNINGGAIALGHPLGMSGARILTSILYEFKNNPNKKYAIVSACIGGGQGIALLLKNGYYKEGKYE